MPFIKAQCDACAYVQIWIALLNKDIDEGYYCVNNINYLFNANDQDNNLSCKTTRDINKLAAYKCSLLFSFQ